MGARSIACRRAAAKAVVGITCMIVSACACAGLSLPWLAPPWGAEGAACAHSPTDACVRWSAVEPAAVRAAGSNTARTTKVFQREATRSRTRDTIRPLAVSKQPFLHGIHHQLATVLDVELAVDVADVVANGLGRDRAVARDLLAAPALGDGGDDVQLALAETRLQRQSQEGLLDRPTDLPLPQ